MSDVFAAEIEVAQGTVATPLVIPSHIAVIPNGHRRKSREGGMTLQHAYEIGAQRALEFAGWARDEGVHDVTFYGLSCDNLLKRPQEQLDALYEGVMTFCDLIDQSDIALHIFGDIDELEAMPKYQPLMKRLSRFRTLQPGHKFVMHAALNYMGSVEHELRPLRDAFYERGFAEVEQHMSAYIRSGAVPPVDLLIRTGGEYRTSGLLPFQMAYAELRFKDCLWVDYEEEHFREDLAWFGLQKRNFGR